MFPPWIGFAATTLARLVLIDSAGERLVFREHLSEHGVVLNGDVDDFDELIGYMAAEAKP